MRRVSTVVALVLVAASAGCSGIAVDSPRFSAGEEGLEVPLGLVVLPFCFLLDALVRIPLGYHDFGPTMFAVTLINPLCNALGGKATIEDYEQPPVEVIVAADSPRRVIDALKDDLAHEGRSIERFDKERLKLATRRTASEGVTEDVSVHASADGDRVRVRIDVTVTGSFDALAGPSSTTTDSSEADEDADFARRESIAQKKLEAEPTTTRDHIRDLIVARFGAPR
jgi:hypothetical protein